MGWRDLFGARPPAAPSPGPDPWNYALAQELAHRGPANPAREPAELRRRVQAAFPNLPAAEAARVVEQLPRVYEAAYEVASQVNQQQLTEPQAAARLQQAFPQLTPGNRSTLLALALLNTR